MVPTTIGLGFVVHIPSAEWVPHFNGAIWTQFLNLLKLQANKFEAGSTSWTCLAKIGNIEIVSEQDQQLGCESWFICIIIIIIINNLDFSSPSTPPILTWKSNLGATLGSLFSEGPQVVSTQIHDNCCRIFKDLEFFSLFGLALGHWTFWSSWSSSHAGSHCQPFKMGLYSVGSCDHFCRGS